MLHTSCLPDGHFKSSLTTVMQSPNNFHIFIVLKNKKLCTEKPSYFDSVHLDLAYITMLVASIPEENQFFAELAVR